MAEKGTDLQKIKELVEIMRNSGLVELEIRHDDDKIFLKRYVPSQSPAGETVSVTPMSRPETGVAVPGSQGTQAPGQPAGLQTAPETEHLAEIKSPIVGTFYATPSPDSEPYVEVGSDVSPQTVVCVIEAMKVMNEIKAEISGTVAEVLVTNGQAVEYGQVLFKIRPD